MLNSLFPVLTNYYFFSPFPFSLNYKTVWMRKRDKGQTVYKKRFVWLDANCHAFLWSKKVRQIERGSGKPLILLPETTCGLRPQSGPLAWEICGAGYNIELKIIDQFLPAADYEAFSPAFWIKAINCLKKSNWGKVMEAAESK